MGKSRNSKEYMRKYMREYNKKYKKENPEKVAAWRKASNKNYRESNKEKVKELVKEWRENEHNNTYKVYMLPNAECYVGYTKAIKPRMYRHKQKGRDYSDYIILHTVKSKEVALALEKMYHNAGFPG